MSHPPAAPADPPVFDLGNVLLSEQPAVLSTQIVHTPLGERMALTIRTPSTTLTLFLQGQDAKNWARQLTATSRPMSSAGLITGNGAVIKGRG
jgi:hypothetical protein